MRTDRLLSILLLLQVHRRLTARDLAQRLEVSERTVLRDMDALSGAGVPVRAERGAGGGWSLLDRYETKLTGLTAMEIQSLFLGTPMRLLSDLGLKREAEAALLKLEASLPAGSRGEAEFARQRVLIDHRGWRDASEAVASLPVLLDALWQNRQIRFEYQAALYEPGERSGDPLGLVAKGSVWYLVASVEGQPRTYRVSRIRQPVVLDAPTIRPVDFDLAAYWEQSTSEFRQNLPRYYATFLVKSRVMHWAKYRGWRVEEETREGKDVRVRIRFDAEEEAVQFALSFGGDLEVLDPGELREKVVAGALAIVERYQTTPVYKDR